MSASIYSGHYSWSMERDEEGHRTYQIAHRVRTTSPMDGPAIVMLTAGLPTVGSFWSFGNEVDSWAFCYPTMSVNLFGERPGEPHKDWLVEQTFSTKPLNRCGSTAIEDPLLEPDRVSGSFRQTQELAKKDKDGNALQYSNLEPMKGSAVTFDSGGHSVVVSQTRLALELPNFSQMINTVNDATLWGMETRKIKLSSVSWERKLYGVCNFFYIRTFNFDVLDKGFDREVLDEGDKVLNGHWVNGVWILDNIDGAAPDPDNPSHYIQSVDYKGNNTHAILDGQGKPLNAAGQAGTGTTGDDYTYHNVQHYTESNFLLLGIPTSLG